MQSEKTKKYFRRPLERHVYPVIGDMDIRTITPPDILGILQKMASDGTYRMMERVKVTISQIFRFAAANGHVTYDPCSALRGAIAMPPTKHHPMFRKDDEIAHMLREINRYPQKRTRLAAMFQIYSICRPGEMRNAEWIERQLAHVEVNRVRAAYNYADFLPDRRRMLQWYADYLDGLRGGPMNLE